MKPILSELTRVYNKPKEDLDSEDEQLLEAFRAFIKDVMDFSMDSISSGSNSGGNFMNFHYVFVVPTGWDLEIRKDFLRPIFVQAGLISKSDDPNRLIFYNELEALLHHIQDPTYQKDYYQLKLQKDTQCLIYTLNTGPYSMCCNLSVCELRNSPTCQNGRREVAPEKILYSTSLDLIRFDNLSSGKFEGFLLAQRGWG